MYLKGYNGTSVKDITDRAGIPKGSFYSYFADKEDYAMKSMEYYNDHFTNTEVLARTDLNPIERIQELFRASINHNKELGLKYGCFVGNLTQEMGNINEEISQVARSIDSTFIEHIRPQLEEAKGLGLLKTDIDSTTLAGFILDTWQGALVRMKMSNNSKALDDFYTVLFGALLK